MFDDIRSFFMKREEDRASEIGRPESHFEYLTERTAGAHTIIITIANQKGGCGKTTTAINLSAALAKRGFKVLMLDIDAQSHASLGIGVDVDNLNCSIYDVLVKGMQLENAIFHTYANNLDIAPATSMLSGAQLEIADLLGREGILRTAIYKMINTSKNDYDYVILDCSPSLNLLTVNGLVAADHILIPIQTHYFSLEGMRELFSTIKIVKERLNLGLQILGILPTLYDPRTRMNKDILKQIQDYFKDKVFKNPIRMNIRLAEASAHRKSIFDFAPDSNGAKDYSAFTEEVITLTRPEKAIGQPEKAAKENGSEEPRLQPDTA
ncbi:MAG: ParA family protein [Candidatus Omnitrophica bacterium]|nr:ParA family protein [Candidatus Omnitrophota bacterium]